MSGKPSEKVQARTVIVVVIAIVLILLASSLLAQFGMGSHSSTSGPASGITSTTRTTSTFINRSSSSTSFPTPYVQDTLFLPNNTLFQGNVRPSIGLNPSALAVDTSNGQVFTADNSTGVVAVPSGTGFTDFRSLDVRGFPAGMAFDSLNGNFYVGNGAFDPANILAINEATESVVANMTIAKHADAFQPPFVYPVSIAFDPSNGDLYASIQGIAGTVTYGGWVSVIDGHSNNVIENITLPGNGTFGFAAPGNLIYDPSNGYLYTADEAAGGGPAEPGPTYGLVTAINSSDNHVVTNIKVAVGATNIALDPLNGCIYAVGSSDIMSVIDGSTNRVVANISVGTGPHDVAYDSLDGHVFVTANNSVVVVDPHSQATQLFIAMPEGTSSIFFDPGNGLLYAASSNAMYVISGVTFSLVATKILDAQPWSIVYDPASHLLYVGDLLSARNFVVNGTTNYAVSVTETNMTSINRTPEHVRLELGAGVVFDSSSGLYYRAGGLSNEVQVLNGSTGAVVTSIKMDYSPFGLAYDPLTNDIFVFFGSQEFQVINGSNNAVGGIRTAYSSLGNQVFGTTFDPANGDVYVTSQDGIAVLNGTAQIEIKQIGSGYYQGVAFDPVDGMLYVTTGHNTVVVIDPMTNTIVATIGVGSNPFGLAVDSSTGLVYVANMYSGTISVISP